MNIGVAGLSHETHTFLPETTGLEPFERDAVRDDAIPSTFRDTNSVIGGFLDACDESGHPVDLVPTVHTRGGVSGTVIDEVYDRYATEITDGFAGEDLDGVLLFLHGAMVTESYLDPETRLVRAVRDVVGDAPVVVAMDLHGNVGPELARAAAAICPYRSSPHVDKHHTGIRAGEILLAAVAGEVSPVTAVAKPGLVVPSVFSATTVSPARDVLARALAWEAEPALNDVTLWDRRGDVLDVSVFFGFAWADVPQIGVAPVAVTDDDPDLAQDIVESIAADLWTLREEFTDPDDLYTVDEGVAYALSRAEATEKPVLLLDHADRLAETTYVLRSLLEQGATDVAVPLLWDPSAVKRCRAAGEGSEVSVPVGSKTSERGGGPVEVTGTVDFVGEVSYTGTGPMRRGEQISHGDTAVIRTDDGVWIQVSTEMTTALVDTDPIERCGATLEEFDVIVSKSKTNFRAAFEERSEEIVIVDAPEYSPADLSQYRYQNVPEGVYPITDCG